MGTGRLTGAALACCLVAVSCASGRQSDPSRAPRDLTSVAASTVSASTANCSWAKVQSPNPASPRFYQALRSVAAESPTDAWALGLAYVPQEGGAERPILLHWDGQHWRAASDAFDRRTRSTDISASSPTNAWAVGSEGRHGVAEQWDGTRWTTSPVADPGTKEWNLEGVEALSQSDVWVVGFMRLGERLSDGFGALVEHWDGHRWSVVRTPALRPSVAGDVPYARLDDVAASGPDDVWAVGETSITSPAAASDTLVEHWNGATWSVAQTPDVASPRGVAFDHLFAAAAVSPTDVWGAGSFGTTDAIGGKGDHPLVLHWGGVRWSSASTPPQQPSPLQDARLGGIAAAGPNAVWAVGSAGSFTQARAIVAAWDGRRWIPSSPGGPGSSLDDVAVDPTGELVLAVGSHISRGAPQRTLIDVCQ